MSGPALRQDGAASNGHATRGGLGRDYFTTGQVARLCGVSARLVIRWVDEGRLKGYRLPSSPDRRIERRELVRFLRRLGVGVALERLGETPALALVVGDTDMAQRLAALMSGVLFAADAFEAGVVVAEKVPATVVLDGGMGRSVVVSMAAAMSARVPSPAVVVLAPEDWPRESWQGLGATHVLQRPVPVARLAKLLGHE